MLQYSGLGECQISAGWLHHHPLGQSRPACQAKLILHFLIDLRKFYSLNDQGHVHRSGWPFTKILQHAKKIFSSESKHIRQEFWVPRSSINIDTYSYTDVLVNSCFIKKKKRASSLMSERVFSVYNDYLESQRYDNWVEKTA